MLQYEDELVSKFQKALHLPQNSLTASPPANHIVIYYRR